MPNDLAAQIELLTSRAAITDALHLYARLIDEGSFDAVSDIFAPDCVAEYGQRDEDTLRSSAAVVTWIRTQLAGVRATSHHISNVSVTFTDPHHAESLSYVYAWHDVTNPPVQPVVFGRYLDQWRRDGDSWRITHRRMFAHGTEKFPPGILAVLRPESAAE
ncbi:nuclear transport factor 2 family protein [Mycolicibacterium porcinum]|uniref:Nuclear transport factor 2 family protein n=1 Tax=Mycolicibacterium porcinum TaxID=39693 RepID=A0AAW5SVN4_9MYCO|nr:nuclear transport factor 2 family protein [Mycolicibacterium porcinum]MCV7386486.1 nuclear transport factor 2 family protein [Mycolicibacterium porcinum]ORB39020.1 hypothetical protein BST41_18565 [Mycolicibacterium porcinum]CDO30844.1 small subunit of phenylpropionate dioxygenase [Mycolicibacterium vulneris]